MYSVSKIRLALLAAVFTLCLVWPFQASMAQVSINMPYSMYGLGELRFNQYFQNMGMAGINQAYRSNLSINDVNPASYAALDTMSFVFEATLFSHFYEQRTSDISQQSDYVSLGNLSVGFPLTRWWSMAAGLKPFSHVGYSIRDQEEHPQAGMVNYVYSGRGGLNQLFIGTAVEPLKGLSFGMNASRIFGNLAYEASVLSDSTGVFQTNLTNANRVTGWIIGLGMQYRQNFSNNRHITIGATYGPQQDVNINSTETLRRKLPGETRFDTIAHNELDLGRLGLPYYYGVGVYGRINSSWAAGLDYQWQNWESFEFLGRQDSFNDSYRIAAGIRYQPVAETFPTLLHRMRYSAGVRYGQSYMKPRDQRLSEFGISFGADIPIRGTLSGLRVHFEYGRRDADDQQMMTENFYRINIGVNIYERWFIRRMFY